MAVKLQLHKPDDDDEGAPELAAGAPDRPTLPRFVMTPTAQRIFDTLEDVHQLGELGGVRGNPGVGKSTALREYARQHKAVLLFSVSDFARSKRDVLGMLCDRFWIEEHLSFRLMKRLTAKLSEEMYGARVGDRIRALIIIDEAQHLTKDAISLMRSLSDETGVGVVFAGNFDTLKERHRSGRSALREPAVWSGEMKQVMSRMSGFWEVERPDVEDVAAFLEACGVNRDDRDLVSCLMHWAMQDGGIRNVQKLLQMALRIECGWPFSREGFDAAAELLGFRAQGRFG
jgi:hypothetical protein